MMDKRGESKVKGFFTEKKDVSAVKENVKVFTGLRFFGNLIKYIIIFAVIIFIIVILFVGLTGSFQSGYSQYLYEKGYNALSKVPFFSSLVETFKVIQDPSTTVRTYGWQADVDKNSQNKELGLTFQKFTSLKQTYLPGETLSFVGSVKINSLKDNSQVKFTCNAITTKIPGIIRPSEPFILPKDSTQVFSVRCEIPSDEIKLAGKKIRAETVVLEATYDFKTDAYVEAYTMSKKLLTEKQDNQEDIFENEDNSRLNKETGEVRSQYTAGPMRVLINSEYSQPFTEAGPFTNDPYYSLGILIQKASSFYQGRLNKINKVYLYMPKNFELSDKEERFELVENEDEVFDKYSLKQKEIDSLNSACKNYNFLDLECQNYWERGFIIALTSFRINYLNKEDLDKNYIRGEVEYEFKAQTSQVVVIAESMTA